MKKYCYSLTILLLCSVALSSCDDQTASTSKASLTYGPKTPMGQDTIQTFVAIDEAGEPNEIGIQFTTKSMNGIPASPEGSTFMLEFPSTVPNPWKFVMVNWNPQGHPPQPYLTPHFDFHFYLASMAEVMAIPGPPQPDFTPIDYSYLPQGYLTDSTAIPAMGVHWVDPTSEEFTFTDTSKRFNQTLIYGTYHGSLTFVEPMIARKFLESPGKISYASAYEIKQPLKYVPGYFPKNYNIRYDAPTDTYTISLSVLAKH